MYSLSGSVKIAGDRAFPVHLGRLDMLQTVSVLLDPQAGDLNDVPGPESNTSMVASNLVAGSVLLFPH